MTWHKIQNSLTADASDMNDNFGHLVSGSIEPYSSAGVSFISTDSSYDLGTTTTRYNNYYGNQIFLQNNLDLGTFYLISENILSSQTSSIEITGLNGDSVNYYNIIIYTVSEQTTASRLDAILNGDSNTNYAHRFITGNGAGIAQGGSNSLSEIRMITLNRATSTANPVALCSAIINTKTGNERLVNKKNTTACNNTYCSGINSECFIWNNTSDTITSIKFYTSGGEPLNAGTVIQLWSR